MSRNLGQKVMDIFKRKKNSIKKFLHFKKYINEYSKLNKNPRIKMFKHPRTTMKTRVIPWFRDNGDKTHRLNYDLNENSIVFDVGGYKGNWAADIFCMHGCKIFIFEPVNEFTEIIEKRFKNNKKVFIYKKGLSNQNKLEMISLNEDSSSIYRKEGNLQTIELIDATEFINGNDINKIDLIKINIEGGEYDLLTNLINYGSIKMIDNVQVQFHDFVPNAEEKMEKLQSELSKTHYLTYQYKFVWENWKRK